jgi:TonB family protein
MRRLALLTVISFLLATPAWDFAQEAPAANSAPHFLKVCSNKNPPPCATPPTRIYAPNPKYSEEARKATVEGTVALWTIVGTDGHAHNIRVARSLGHGLDEQAIETLKQWKMEPGTSEGVPVPVEVRVEMIFRLHP